MKNLKKTLAVVTAIAAMTASVPAFAATTKEMEYGANMASSTFNEETFEVTATVNANDIDGGEMSFVVLNAGADETNVAAEDILFIDQHSSTEGATFAGKINRYNLDELPEGDYKVKIGYNSKAVGDFTIAVATLKVREANTGKTVTIKWGDVDLDGSADGTDMLAVLYAFAGKTTSWTKDGYTYTFNSSEVEKDATKYELSANESSVKWGDVDLDGSADGTDMLAVLYAFAGKTTSWTKHGQTFGFNTDKELTLTK